MIIAATSISSDHALFGRAGGTHVPPEVIASWPTPNYHSPEERSWGAPIALSIVLGITLLVYIARMWTRLTMTKNAGVDDVLISIAVIPLVGLTVSAILGVKIFGFQWHIWDQTAKTKKTTRYTSMSIELNYMICTTLIKISILFFYRRLTGSLTNRFVHAVWACIAICVIYFIVFVVLTFFTCSIAKGRKNCVEEGAFIVAVTAFSAVQDLVICSLPAFLITGLQMPKRQKFALCGIFGLGFVTTVCGIMRMYYAVYVYYFTYDVTWYAYYGWIWTVLEANLGLICASAPALRVFFRHSLGLMSYTGTYRSGGHKTPVHKTPSQKMPVILLSAREVHSGPSAGSARGTDTGDHICLDSIMVERGLSSKVEERDDASQRSDSSTKNLTTIIYGPLSK